MGHLNVEHECKNTYSNFFYYFNYFTIKIQLSNVALCTEKTSNLKNLDAFLLSPINKPPLQLNAF